MRSISRIGIAMAVAGACGYAAAGTTNVTAKSLAREVADVNTGTVTLLSMDAANAMQLGSSSVGTGQRLVFTPGGSAEFVVGDGAGSAAATGWSPSFTCEVGAATTGSIVFTLATGASSSTAIVYDVLKATSGLSGASCKIPSIAFTAASMRTTGNVTLTGAIKVVNTGETIDSFSATKVASVGNAFSVSVTAGNGLDGVIDVTKNRVTFASNGDAITGFATGGADKLTLSFDDSGVRDFSVGNSSASNLSLTVTLSADAGFQFLQEPSTTAGASLNCSADEGSGQATAYASAAWAKSSPITVTAASGATSGDCKTLTVAFNSITGADTDIVIGLGRKALNQAPSESTAFASNVYTAGYSFNRASATLTAANSSTTIAAGAWTQNGASGIRLNYVPLTDNTSLQVLISNNSSTAGVAEFVAYSGGATCTGNLGAVAANGVTSVGGALRSALRGTPNSSTQTNCTTTFDDVSGNAAVVLSTTTPSASTKVHSGFTVTGDTNPRQILINSTN